MRPMFDEPTEDNPELTVEELATAKTGRTVFSEEFIDGMADERKKRRGRGPQKAPTKRLVTIRLSPEVVAFFRKKGPGWQRRIDDTLKNYLASRGTRSRPARRASRSSRAKRVPR